MFDAIVVGSGISGGWAVKELTQRGLKVLLLERGKMIRHGQDYHTEHMPPWKVPFRGMPLRELYDEEYPIQSQVYAFDETTRHFFNNDKQNPYQQNANKPFMWHRADVLGGRSLLWGRQVYRWSDLDFEANRRDGHGIDWPIRYKDIAPWYDHVESFVGVSGQSEGLPQLPDGVFQPPMKMNVVEKQVKRKIEEHFPGRIMTMGRCAIQTEPKNNRGACHYCGPCERGCSVGAYFSSQSSTLPAAEKTGNLTLRTDSVVERLEYDPKTRRVSAVHVVDANSKEKHRFAARMVFLCASTVASTQILLNSRSDEYPRGLGNRSGVLGRYLMDHTLGTGAFGMMPGYMDQYYQGNRPNNAYIPRFRNLHGQDTDVDFIRGYGYQGLALRMGWKQLHKQLGGFGARFKQKLRGPGPWAIFLAGFGEHLPDKNSRMYLSSQTDRFGIPQVAFDSAFGDNEHRMRKDIADQADAMLKKSGAVAITPFIDNGPPGKAIHEMGTARMGVDPDESVLNKWNQAHDVDNLFVTDGSCMTSSSCVNPSLTYMALTARAANYAADAIAEGRI